MKPAWKCNRCQATFDDPVEREPHRVRGVGKSGLGLESMDPEDVGLSPLGERPDA